MITDAEWEVMTVIWAHPEGIKSKAIIDKVKAYQPWKDATIKTLIHRLLDKGAIQATKDGKSYIYKANCMKHDMIIQIMQQWLQRVCDKDKASVMIQVLQTIPITKSDLETLKHTVEILESRAVEHLACHCKCQCIEDTKE